MIKTDYTINNLYGVFYVYNKYGILVFMADTWKEVVEEFLIK